MSVSPSSSSSSPAPVTVDVLVGEWRLVAIDGGAVGPGEDDQGNAIGVRLSKGEAGRITFAFNSFCNSTGGSGTVAVDGAFEFVDGATTLVACDDPFDRNLHVIDRVDQVRLLDGATRLQLLREDEVLAEYLRLN